jgi:hypothetical protein
MRIVMASLVAAGLIATHAFAADAPLPPGKAAGVKAAQERDNTMLYLFGAGAIAAGIIILANGDSDSKLTPGTPPPATTTGT